jgi:FkbM family methyltransferase
LKNAIKSGVKKLINGIIIILETNLIGRYIYAQIIETSMNRVQKISYRDTEIMLSIPNPLNRYRAHTFFTKEPETLEWIDSIPEGSVLWDIGANVGLYTCYAAKIRGCRVFAFEPSVFNLELLARNIEKNGLVDLVTIVPMPLSNQVGVNKLNMTTTEWGGALSTFGQEFGHDGLPMAKIFSYSTIGITMTDAVSALGVQPPEYIKIDVDGIEHLILQAGGDALHGAKSVLVEINDKFIEQASAAEAYLKLAGFTLREKRHAALYDNVGNAAQFTFNQIWTK